MKAKHLLIICILGLLMTLFPKSTYAQVEYDHTEYVTIKCGEIITLDPTTLSGEAGTYFRWYRNHLSNKRNVAFCDLGSDFRVGLENTNDYYVKTTISGVNYYDSYKCDVMGLKPGTYTAELTWHTESRYYNYSGGTTGYVYVRCKYIITVKDTSNPKLTLSVNDTCKRVIKGTNIKFTPSVSGATVYCLKHVGVYSNGVWTYGGYDAHWENTSPSFGVTINENTAITARAVKQDYPVSDSFHHIYQVIEPGDFHVLLSNGVDTHFKVISESEKTCGVYFVPGTAEGSFRIPSTINGYKVTCIQAKAFDGCTRLTSVEIPESVDSIGDYAFYGCSALTTMDIPNSVTSIGKLSFNGCSALKSIKIPNSVTSIGYCSFWDCISLERIEFPANLSKIEAYTCYGCSNLQEVVIPNSVKVIEKYAFNGCNSLKTVTSFIEDPFPINENTFITWTAATLYVPKGSKEKYESTGGWLLFNKIEEIRTDWQPTDISKLDNVIYLEEVRANAGGTATLSFRMKNSAAIRGFQFDLYLPDGVTAVKNAKGRIQGALSNGRLDDGDEHTLTLQEQADGSIRFLCGSQYDETFTGNEGEIATLQIKIADDMDDGEYPIELKNMRLSETDISKYYDTEQVKSTLTVIDYMTGDINGDGVVNVSDYIGIANHILGSTPTGFIEKAADVNEDNTINVSDYIGVANIILTGSPYGNSNNVKMTQTRAASIIDLDGYIYVEPITVKKGTTQASLSFMMNNYEAIRGFQFDLYLPDGVTAVKNAKGRIQGALSNGRLDDGDEHTLTLQEQADGAIRFLCGSQYDETFTGHEGEIATLQVNIAEDIVVGDYPIVLRNMRLTETNISKFYDSNNVESMLTIKEEDDADMIVDVFKLDDHISAPMYNLSGQRVTNPRKGIYIQNRKKVLVK